MPWTDATTARRSSGARNAIQRPGRMVPPEVESRRPQRESRSANDTGHLATPGDTYASPAAFADGLQPDKRWRYTAEWMCWNKACDAAGVEHIRPNWGGRHAFITHEIKGGTDPVAVQKWAGHRHFSTTQIYLDEYDEVELARAMRPRTAQALPKPKKRR